LGKIRINKLALELNIPNDKIIDELKKKDIPVKNHMSSIDGEVAEYIRGLFTDKTAVKAKKKAAIKKAAAKKKSTVAKPITAKTAAKAAAKKKADEEKQAKEEAKKPKVAAKPKAAPAKAQKEETEPDKPRKLGLKVVVKPEELPAVVFPWPFWWVEILVLPFSFWPPVFPWKL